MHLIDEILQQPQVIADLIAREHETALAIAAAIRQAAPEYVVIAARGTSDNAARYAQYAFGALAGLPVALAAPSLHTLYRSPPRLDKALVIGISQSGQAADVRKVIEDARAQGAPTVAITNFTDSPLAQAAEHHLWLGAGTEQSIAATKTYTAQLAAVALLVAALDEDGALHAELTQIPAAVTATLESLQTTPLDQPGRIERYRYMDRYTCLGRGYNYATACEINLKISELSYTTGTAYSEADFRHGPIATLTEGYPVILVAPSGRTFGVVRDLAGTLVEKRAELLVISDNAELLALAKTPMPLPAGIPEWLSPLVAVVPGQVVALRLTLARDLPVDKPRGLQKVTITE